MYERKYKDESDWHAVTEKEVRNRLDGYYYDLDLAIDNLKSGFTLDTPYAFYRFTKESSNE